MDLLSRLGALRVPVTFAAIQGLNSNRSGDPIPPHRHLGQLAAAVPYVRFIVAVRKFFLVEFLRHQADFPGVDGEALFVATVLHSTEHANAEYFVDEFALTPAGRFGGAFETAILSRFLTTPLVVGRCVVDSRFKCAAHPLFRRVYAYATTLDRRLADEMETAIMR